MQPQGGPPLLRVSIGEFLFRACFSDSHSSTKQFCRGLDSKQSLLWSQTHSFRLASLNLIVKIFRTAMSHMPYLYMSRTSWLHQLEQVICYWIIRSSLCGALCSGVEGFLLLQKHCTETLQFREWSITTLSSAAQYLQSKPCECACLVLRTAPGFPPKTRIRVLSVAGACQAAWKFSFWTKHRPIPRLGFNAQKPQWEGERSICRYLKQDGNSMLPLIGLRQACMIVKTCINTWMLFHCVCFAFVHVVHCHICPRWLFYLKFMSRSCQQDECRSPLFICFNS